MNLKWTIAVCSVASRTRTGYTNVQEAQAGGFQPDGIAIYAINFDQKSSTASWYYMPMKKTKFQIAVLIASSNQQLSVSKIFDPDFAKQQL